MAKKRLLVILLAFFLLGDLVYSFIEYYYTPLDGDLSSGVVANQHIQKIFDDPFGFRMLLSGEKHINPNRYFSHVFQKEYMQTVPFWLQYLTDPITSVYLSCALLKIGVHMIFLFIISAMISGTTRIFKRSFLLAAALVIPFIQVNGYWGHMGINDRATTYVFFFSLPVVLLLAYLSFFFKSAFTVDLQKKRFVGFVLILVASVTLPLSGPLVPGIALIVCLLIFIFFFKRYYNETGSSAINKFLFVVRNIPFSVYAFLVPLALVSLYSLFLGLSDSNFQEITIPVLQRYLKLPLGIYYQITQSLGVPLLLLTIAINVYLAKRILPVMEQGKTLSTIKWIGLFALIYLLFLPLGGYRPYRPNILRYDTFIPITIALVYFCSNSTYLLLSKLSGKTQTYYGIYLLTIFAIYMNSDRIETGKYEFERHCIETLAKSPDKITKLPATFNVMSWGPVTNPGQSGSNAVMLEFWNITKGKKLYYQTNE